MPGSTRKRLRPETSPRFSAQRRPFSRLFLLLALAVVCLATACAPKTASGPFRNADTAQKFWQMVRRTGTLDAPLDLNLRASMYVNEGHKSARMRLSLWGSTALPLRLDLLSTIGSPVAYASQTRTVWTIFYPDSNQAFTHSDARRALPALNLPLPFSLQDMALLLTGHGMALLPKTYVAADALPDGGWSYTLAKNQVEKVDFDGAGNIVRMQSPPQDAKDSAWTMDLSRYGKEDFPHSPAKIILTMGRDKSARIFLKSVEIRNQPWPTNATRLDLPEDVVPIPLDGRACLY